MFHYFDIFNDLGLTNWDDYIGFFYEGFLSDNFFFIISGFCIQYGYRDRLINSSISVKDFLFGRFAHFIHCIWCAYSRRY